MKNTTAANERANKEYACLLAFDVKVMPDAEQFAEENQIKIFTAKIIYHLFDEFTEYVEECKRERKSDKGQKAVFPCILQVSKDQLDQLPITFSKCAELTFIFVYRWYLMRASTLQTRS